MKNTDKATQIYDGMTAKDISELLQESHALRVQRDSLLEACREAYYCIVQDPKLTELDEKSQKVVVKLANAINQATK